MFYNFWHKLKNASRAVYLLASLVTLIFVYPAISDLPIARTVLGILFAVTPLAGVYAISTQKRTMVAATVMAAPAILSILGHFFLDTPLLTDQLFLGIMTVYYTYTTIAIIRHIFKKHSVDVDTIISAVSAYLMIGLSFAVAFMLVHFSSQGALSEATADRLIEWQDIFYFSLVTLTTLGYGDISPVVPVARSLATLEAVCGVMYMSVLLARLVSDYQSSRRVND